MNLFTWSFPFLVDKVAEILEYVVLKNTIVSKKEIEQMYKQEGGTDFDSMIDSLINDQQAEDEKHINKIKAKIITIGRMSQMMKKRSTEGKLENEKRMSFKKNGDDRISSERIRKSMVDATDEGSLFVNIKDADKANEKFPI